MKVDKNSLYQSCAICPKSRHCCYRATTIVVLPSEAERIAEATGRGDLLKEEVAGLFTIVKRQGEPCPFLTGQGLCGIYDIRPTDCRSWPLTLSRQAASVNEYIIDAGCSAVEEDRVSEEFIQAAKQVLNKIDDDLRLHFIELVHRDTLPLVPLSSGVNREGSQ